MNKLRRGITVMSHPYVFLAIEFGSDSNCGETKILGVYTTREIVENKIGKTQTKHEHSPRYGDYGVLKKTIEGRRY